MDRRTFEFWGIELEPAAFARALAAFGVLVGHEPDSEARLDQRGVGPTAEAFAERLQFIVEAAQARPGGGPAQPLRWQLGVTWRDLVTPELAPILADAWSKLFELTPSQVRIEVQQAEWWQDPAGPTWLVEQLSLSDSHVASVFVGLDDAATRHLHVQWRWPLRVGFLDDPASRRLLAELEQQSWYPALATLAELRPERESCDLLIVPADLRSALAGLLQAPARATCVVLLGHLTEPWDRAQPLLAALRAGASSTGLAFAPVTDAGRVAWFNRLMEELSHDAGLDVALFAASRGTRSAPPLFFANRRLLDSTLLSRVAEAFERRAERTSRGAVVLPELHFDSEARGAHELARGAQGLRAAEQRFTPRPRFIQVRVFEHLDPARPRLLERAFLANAPHAIDVRIGPGGAGWTTADRSFPDEELPASEGPHRLTVAFTELNSQHAPQVAEILLPPAGDSSSCRFFLHSGPSLRRLEARIVVLFRNRVLQTARLSGPVSPAAGVPGSPTRIELTIEAVVRSRIDDLADRRDFDAALILNRTDEGRRLITTVAGALVELTAPEGIEQAVTSLRSLLERMIDDPEAFSSLESQRTIELLVILANHGSALYDELVGSQAGTALAASKRLQVVSARAEAYLPLEFAYDRPAPLPGSGLCSNARAALRDGVCPADCLDGVAADSVVCPLGFWSLSKVIERHLHDPASETRPEEGFAILCEPTTTRARISAISSALFAASDRVDGFESGRTAALLQTLQRLTDGQVERAGSWTAWEEGVRTHRPSLLVLLPHTLQDRNFLLPALEVGAAEQLLCTQVKAQHVRISDETRPIVLLLGCETGDPALPYQRFPAAFRKAGAAIVLATLTKVLGRHAAPLAERLAQALVERSTGPDVTFGDLMLQVRREFLAEGVPVVLALTAYGDADWVLGAEQQEP